MNRIFRVDVSGLSPIEKENLREYLLEFSSIVTSEFYGLQSVQAYDVHWSSSGDFVSLVSLPHDCSCVDITESALL